MLFGFVEPSLRRAITIVGLLVATSAVVVSGLAVVTLARLRSTMEVTSAAFSEEQHIADRITSLAFAQQLDAYRFLQSGNPLTLAQFDSLGDLAQSDMHRYLFHQLSDSARLRIEGMREAHQQFEVIAHRLFDLAKTSNRRPDATRRLGELDASANALDQQIAQFVQLRVVEQSKMRLHNASLTNAVRALVVVACVGLLVLAAVLSRAVSRRVLRPLEDVIEASDALRHGRAEARVPPQRFQEVNSVASAFNEMADAMQQAQQTVASQNEELRGSLDQLHQAQDELIQKERLGAMGEMLAGLAHELNNPLASVLGLAEVLEAELRTSKDPSATELERSVLPLVAEARRARELVRSLLNFTRGANETSPTVSLSRAVTLAAQLRSEAFAKAGKSLVVDVPSDLYVRADAQKLQQIFLNLTNNALDALRDQGTTFSIVARCIPDGLIEIEATDNGPGFTNTQSVFTPFYTTKPAERGTGLGLALVQRFIAEFGGSVEARNTNEGGAQLRIVLPAAVAPLENAHSAPVETPQASAPPPSGERATARRRVLVVDDEPALREVQRRILTLEGFDVALAASGAEARDLIEREPPDLIVSDLRMPGEIDGRDLYAWLKQAHPGLAKTALFVTGELPRHAEHGDALPEDRVIPKPFTRQEYVARVRDTLRSAGSDLTS